MAAETNRDDSRLADLHDVYDILQKDAKEMATDLLNGITMWRSASVVCFSLAALALVVGLVIAIYVGFYSPSILAEKIGKVGPVLKVNIPGGPKVTVIVATALLFVVSALSAGAGAFYMRRYFFLRKKYSDLRATLQKLG